MKPVGCSEFYHPSVHHSLPQPLISLLLQAPELHRVNGNWMIIHTARDSGGQLNVGLGISTSGKAYGPYVDAIGAPLLKDPSGMGTIDATLFADTDGRLYVIAKTDGNAVGKPTPIHIAEVEVKANGTRFAPGDSLAAFYASQLITSDLPWEEGITEGPWMVRAKGFIINCMVAESRQLAVKMPSACDKSSDRSGQ